LGPAGPAARQPGRGPSTRMMQAQPGRPRAVQPPRNRLARGRAAWAPTALRLAWYAALLGLAALFAAGVPASYRLLSSGAVGVLLERDGQGRIVLDPHTRPLGRSRWGPAGRRPARRRRRAGDHRGQGGPGGAPAGRAGRAGDADRREVGRADPGRGRRALPHGVRAPGHLAADVRAGPD